MLSMLFYVTCETLHIHLCFDDCPKLVIMDLQICHIWLKNNKRKVVTVNYVIYYWKPWSCSNAADCRSRSREPSQITSIWMEMKLCTSYSMNCLSLPRNSMIRLSDQLDVTLIGWLDCKTTIQTNKRCWYQYCETRQWPMKIQHYSNHSHILLLEPNTAPSSRGTNVKTCIRIVGITVLKILAFWGCSFIS